MSDPRPLFRSSASGDRILAFSVVFAATVGTLRVVILVGSAGWGAVPPLGAALASMVDHLVVGAVLGVLALLSRSALARWAVRVLLVLVLSANSAAFVYESVFLRLPTRGVFFYLSELGELAPSLRANGPGVVLALLLLAAVLGLAYVARRLQTSALPLCRPAVAWSVLALLVLFAGLLRVAPGVPSAVHPSRCRAPLPWLAESWLRQQLSRIVEQPQLGAQQFLEFQYQIGVRPPTGMAHGPAPLCAEPAPRSDGDQDPPSAILLLLESVGSREMLLELDGEALMPQLRAFAERQHALLDVKAAGTKSVSAMPAVFAGLPPQTDQHLLHLVPLPSMQGFPNELVAHGYRTAYFHGADLNWEFQRSFLRMVGMQEISERDPRTPTPVYGWGYADGETLGRLRSWVVEHRRLHRAQAYFAALFTLSSHDPYDLPPEWPRRFGERRAEDRQYESLAYLDHQLGEFFAWYERDEAPRGTVLVMVGDHSPHLFNTIATVHGPVFRFEVPVVIAAPRRRVEVAPASLRVRRGAQHDLPATLLACLGLPAGPCDQGVDLLAPAPDWPEDRVVYSVGGEDLDEIQLWAGEEHVVVDRLFRGVRRIDGDGERPVSARLERFLEILLPLNRFLIRHGAYAPPQGEVVSTQRALPRVVRPLVVSHRGKLTGESDPHAENRIEAVARAFAAAFDAVEVDLQMSRDGVPLLVHDARVRTAAGDERSIVDLDFAELRSQASSAGPWTTLAELLGTFPDDDLVVELKPQPDFAHQLRFAETVAELLRPATARRRIIADSFSLVQVSTLEPLCGCEVGWDLPYRQPVSDEFLRSAVLADVDWIFVEHSVLSREVIARAHRAGLRVMAYTVNDPRDVERLAPELPDGLITDSVEILELFTAPR